MPLDQSFLTVDGNVRVTALKVSEDKTGVVVRLFNVGDRNETYRCSFGQNIEEAIEVNLNEMPVRSLSVNANTVFGELPPYQVHSVLVRF